MVRTSFAAILLLALAPVLVACSDDDETTGPETTYDLTFSGDASFQGAHGDQPVAVAVVDSGTGEVVADGAGTVSAVADPAFSFTFSDALVAGTSYHVDYWIDSNFGGGELGTCDPPEIDHQWRVDVGTANSDIAFEDSHRAGDIESVCSTFE